MTSTPENQALTVRFLPDRQAIGGLLQRLTLLCGVSGGGAELSFRALYSCPLLQLLAG
jgi:hypothetical protein